MSGYMNHAASYGLSRKRISGVSISCLVSNNKVRFLLDNGIRILTETSHDIIINKLLSIKNLTSLYPVCYIIYLIIYVYHYNIQSNINAHVFTIFYNVNIVLPNIL